MRLLAIDPGTHQSAYCLMDEEYRIIDAAKVVNDDLIRYIYAHAPEIDHIAVEMIACYHMPVGAEVFETCVMIGKIERVAEHMEISHSRVYRSEEKGCIAGDSKAGDKEIRAGLIRRFAEHDLKRGKGTKKDPDYFYGFADDMWAAFAVGVVYLDGIKGLFERKEGGNGSKTRRGRKSRAQKRARPAGRS